MTDEEINIAIAEACGWRKCTRGCGCEQPHWDHPEDVKLGGHGERIYELPDYCNDLNDMYEAEKILTHDKQMQYVRYIANPWDTDPNGNYWKMWLCASATARQRAEAFLKTLNLWKD